MTLIGNLPRVTTAFHVSLRVAGPWLQKLNSFENAWPAQLPFGALAVKEFSTGAAGAGEGMVNSKEWPRRRFCKLSGRHFWELPHNLQGSRASAEKYGFVAVIGTLLSAPAGVG